MNGNIAAHAFKCLRGLVTSWTPPQHGQQPNCPTVQCMLIHHAGTTSVPIVDFTVHIRPTNHLQTTSNASFSLSIEPRCDLQMALHTCEWPHAQEAKPSAWRKQLLKRTVHSLMSSQSREQWALVRVNSPHLTLGGLARSENDINHLRGVD